MVCYRDVEELIEKLKFENVRGPARGQINKKVRSSLESSFSKIQGLSADLFRKRIDRIIWELAVFITFDEIIECVEAIIAEHY
jgi:DNA replication initiation complex subunit (GINS family)